MEKNVADQLKLDDLQSYDAFLSVPGVAALPDREQRQSGRKLLEVDVVLTLDGVPIQAKTVDLSTGGLCLNAVRQLPVGKECYIQFSILAASQVVAITAQAQVIYCFYISEQEFRAGIEFINADQAALDAIHQFFAG